MTFFHKIISLSVIIFFCFFSLSRARKDLEYEEFNQSVNVTINSCSCGTKDSSIRVSYKKKSYHMNVSSNECERYRKLTSLDTISVTYNSGLDRMLSNPKKLRSAYNLAFYFSILVFGIMTCSVGVFLFKWVWKKVKSS